MKRISLYATSLIILGAGLTSCDQLHNDLRLEVPTNYVLETPEGADQLMIFGISGSNVNNELKVVTYNPYNVNTTVDFQVQVAKSVDDFTTWDNLVADDLANGTTGSEYNYTDSEGLPYVSTISGIYTSPSFTIPGADFCDGINALYGWESADDITGPVQVAYRVHAWVPNVNYSSIFSNIVELAQVQSYIPIREPRKLYLIGQPQGWDINSDAMYVQEIDPGSNIYQGKFNISAGQFQFRFYKELGDWETNSIGSQNEDNPIEIEFTNDTYDGPVVVYNAAEDILGKGSWQYSSWEGGSIDVTINLNDNTISIVAHEGEETPSTPTGNVLYLVGEPQGWNISSSDMYASETSSGSNIYVGVFTIPTGKFMFRFYSALGNWDANSIGSQNEDNPIEISFTDGSYSGPVVPYDESADILGKGSWSYPGWEEGTIKVTINLNDNTIKMENYEVKNAVYIVGACQGWDINSDAMPLYETENGSNIYSGTYDIAAGNLQFKIYSELGNWDANHYGSMVDDENLEITVPFSGDVYDGKGNWHDASFSGTATITLNLNTMKISIEK